MLPLTAVADAFAGITLGAISAHVAAGAAVLRGGERQGAWMLCWVKLAWPGGQTGEQVG